MGKTGTSDRGRKYSCRQCGHPYEVYPPDDVHPDFLLEPCAKGDSVKMIIKCQNCHGEFPIYWDTHHVFMVSG